MSVTDLEARLQKHAIRPPSLGDQLAINVAQAQARAAASAMSPHNNRREKFQAWAIQAQDRIAFAIACGTSPDQTCIPDAARHELLEIVEGRGESAIWQSMRHWAAQHGLALAIRWHTSKDGAPVYVSALTVSQA